MVSYYGFASWFRIVILHRGFALWFRIVVSHRGFVLWFRVATIGIDDHSKLRR